MIDFGVPPSGMNRASSDLNQVAQKIAGIGGSPAGDTVDLSAEAVAMLEAKNAFQANTQVLRVDGEMTQAMLDVLG